MDSELKIIFKIEQTIVGKLFYTQVNAISNQQSIICDL